MIKAYLVGGIPTPLKNITSSVGMVKFPTEWKNKIHMFQTTNQILNLLLRDGVGDSWG